MIEFQTKTLDGYFVVKVPTAKRCLDIIGAGIAIVILAPVMIFLALFIKAVSPGPVFFNQPRTGRGGSNFTCYKFRTMHANADTSDHQAYLAQLINGNSTEAETPMTKLEKSSKIIPLGCLVRSLGLDELPQLFNVIKGEMSLVGPRPAIPYEVHEYQPWHKQRLDVVPGITGLWQVSGKNKLSFKSMIRLDLQYARQQSLRLDILILLKTPQAVLGQAAEHVACRINEWIKGGLKNG